MAELIGHIDGRVVFVDFSSRRVALDLHDVQLSRRLSVSFATSTSTPSSSSFTLSSGSALPSGSSLPSRSLASTVINYRDSLGSCTLPPARAAPRMRRPRIAAPPEHLPGSLADSTVAEPSARQPEAWSPGTPELTDLTNRSTYDGQFAGTYRGVTWNAQGLFMAKASAQQCKRLAVQKLLRNRDFVMITETHSEPGGLLGYRPLQGTTAYWSSGTAARAGVGIVLTNAFLQKFDSQPHWDEPCPGRLARLRLRGPQGGLDLVVAYFPTGTRRPLPQNKAAAAARLPQSDEEEDPPTLRAQRMELIRQIRGALAPTDCLTILAGDFNFVPTVQDRLNLQTGEFTGGKDAAEQQLWTQLLPPHALHELHQPQHTYAGPLATSRLDRVYVNQHVVEQLDRQVFAIPLEFNRFSQHRPLSFGRLCRSPDSARPLPLAVEVIRDERWPTMVALELQELDRCLPASSCPLVRLRRLKAAMRSAADLLSTSRSASPETEEKPLLTVAMATLRRSERLGREEIPRSLARHPDLKRALPTDISSRPFGDQMAALRELAVSLAKEEARAALQAVQSSADSLPPDILSRQRERVMRKIKRLCPGRAAAVLATTNGQGEVVTEPAEVAAVLRDHWASTFSHKPINRSALRRWLQEDRDNPCGLQQAFAPLVQDPQAWTIRRRDIRRAISLSGDSAAGPDGIPYEAWRRLGDMGADFLLDAARVLCGPGATAALQQAFPRDQEGISDFNAAVMVFIPKKSPQEQNGREFHLPGDVRPLSIVNTDNRLIANALRLRIEPLAARGVSAEQRGFLPGRSLLCNVLDVDESMRLASLQGEDPGAVFFDFAAAFPSIAHEFMKEVLEHIGLPLPVRNLVAALYFGHGCKLAVAGGLFAGFAISAGIRQGCPLSPLLFAICGDLLLRKLSSLLPGDTVRAYADDIALVARSLSQSASRFVPLFNAFALLSGLALNLRKTVFVPLGEDSPDLLRSRLEQLCPGWGLAAVRFHADYLGFCLGPLAEEKAWDKVLTKMAKRATAWGALGLGLHFTTLAYNVYVASVPTFLLQLDRLPSGWRQAEAAAFRRLAPGPGAWVLPKDLHSLKDVFGMPQQFTKLEEVDVATKFRVAHREADGKLQVNAHVRRLEAAYADTEHLVRAGRWRSWFKDSAYHRLQAAVTACGSMGIHLADVELALGASQPRPHTRATHRRLSGGVQQVVRRLIHARRGEPPELRLRHKLQKWPLQLFPRLRAQRALQVLARLRSLVPPRVLAALMRTWYDGWCTRRRFQGRDSSCLFGCTCGDDSVQHYCCCGALHDFAVRGMRLPPQESRADKALAFMLLEPASRLPDDVLARRALLLAAAYALHCHHRRRQGPLGAPAEVARALEQAAKEAARGHRRATACLDSRWVQLPQRGQRRRASTSS